MSGRDEKGNGLMGAFTKLRAQAPVWTTVASAVVMLAALGPLSGCDTEAFCFSCGEGVAAGGQSGAGGQAGAAGGVGLGGSAGKAGGGGGLAIGCNASINLQTDPQNCGACDNVCAKPNGAIPGCTAGKCTYACAPNVCSSQK